MLPLPELRRDERMFLGKSDEDGEEVSPMMVSDQEKDTPRSAVHYMVISRTCADLYDELVDLFKDRPDIKVILDRRLGGRRQARRRVRKNRRSGGERRRIPPVDLT